MRAKPLLIGFLLLWSIPRAEHVSARVDPTPMTRAQVVRSLILARDASFPAVSNRGKFPDITRGTWYEPYMLFAAQEGIIEPDASGLLKPEEAVTRAAFLKMLTIALKLPTGYAHRYRDVSDTAWYFRFAGIAWHYELFASRDIDTLEPDRRIEREEVERIIALLQGKEGATNPEEEQALAFQQARGKLKLYNVISTRRESVIFTDPEERKDIRRVVPIVRLPTSLPTLRTQILALVNKERAAAGLDPLTYSRLLEVSAQAYATRMANENFFGHVAPDGQTLKDRISATSYYDRSFLLSCKCVPGFALGENLARGQKTPQEVVDAWMRSPSHRDAILNPDYSDIGVGVSAGYWVQHFGGKLLPGQNVHASNAVEKGEK